MIAKPFFVASIAAAALLSLLAASSLVAGPPSATGNPDFTKGDKIPEGADHDWNLGATGARGWMFCDKLVTTDARQIAITEVEQNSPADGILAVGDVILASVANLFPTTRASSWAKRSPRPNRRRAAEPCR